MWHGGHGAVQDGPPGARTWPDGSATRRMMRDRNATATPSPGPPSARVTLMRPLLPPLEPPETCVPARRVARSGPGRTRCHPARPPASRLAAQCVGPLPGRETARLPRRRDARRRQDRLRAPGGRGAARGPDDHRRHGRHPHRAPQAPVGGGRGVGRDRARPRVPELDGLDVVGLHRHRDHLRRRRRAPGAAPQPDRDPADVGDPRRGAPHGRRALVGRRGPRGVRAAPRAGSRSRGRRSAATTTRSPSSTTCPTPKGSCAAAPTTPTATPRRWPTAWCGPWSSSPTPARRAGGRARARRSPRGSVSR